MPSPRLAQSVRLTSKNGMLPGARCAGARGQTKERVGLVSVGFPRAQALPAATPHTGTVEAPPAAPDALGRAGSATRLLCKEAVTAGAGGRTSGGARRTGARREHAAACPMAPLVPAGLPSSTPASSPPLTATAASSSSTATVAVCARAGVLPISASSKANESLFARGRPSRTRAVRRRPQARARRPAYRRGLVVSERVVHRRGTPSRRKQATKSRRAAEWRQNAGRSGWTYGREGRNGAESRQTNGGMGRNGVEWGRMGGWNRVESGGI